MDFAENSKTKSQPFDYGESYKMTLKPLSKPNDPQHMNIFNFSKNRNNDVSKFKTGRWDKDEHARFVEAIKKYGKNWKIIDTLLPTRSSVQIRSHAQKFFRRLKKAFKGTEKDFKMPIGNKRKLEFNIII